MFPGRVLRTTWLASLVALGIAQAPVAGGEPTDFPTEARQRYEQGRQLQKQGQLDEALSAFEEAIQLGMDAFPRVHLQRANTNLDLKKYDAAIAQYTKFIEEFGLEASCRY